MIGRQDLPEEDSQSRLVVCSDSSLYEILIKADFDGPCLL